MFHNVRVLRSAYLLLHCEYLYIYEQLKGIRMYMTYKNIRNTKSKIYIVVS